MALALPQFAAIKSFGIDGYLYYKDDGSVVVGEKNLLSTAVKIELETSTVGEAFVHLRFCYFNRFWQKSADSNSLVAQTNQPEEDTSKPSSTLFEVVKETKKEFFYLRHVQSNTWLRYSFVTKDFYLDPTSSPEDGYFEFVDLDLMVQLPTDSVIGFKNKDGVYLQSYPWDSYGTLVLKFLSSEPDYDLCGHRVNVMDDGTVGFQSIHSSKFWRVQYYQQNNENLVDIGYTEDDANYGNARFQPMKVDENTIALRSLSHNLFCRSYSDGGKITNLLSASAADITTASTLQVEELVRTRRIYRVVYKMDRSRIFNQTPYEAGTTTLTNHGDEEASMGVEMTIQNEVSYSFSNSLSLSLGVSTTIEAGLLGIEETSITVTAEIDTSMEWNTTVTTTTSITATATVPVPAKSWVSVSYVGTKGTCNVPFEYMQEDVSVIDGTVTRFTKTDGIYTGVNSYNFDFVTSEPMPIEPIGI